MSNKKTYRKYAATTMAAAAAVASVAPVATAAETSKDFSDVNKNHDFYTQIMDLTEQGIINGFEDGTFRPKDYIKRVQVANILIRAQNLTAPADIDEVLKDYKDVNADSEYAKEIATVTKEGIFGGNQHGNFNPWKEITREQMASVLVRAYNLEKYDTGEKVEINLEGVDESHKKNVQILANLGITQGKALEDFNPNGDITRGQFAAQIHRTLEVVNAVEVAPEITNISAINATQAKVTFKGAVPEGVDFTNFDIDGGLTVTNVEFSTDRKSATITASSEFVRDQEYTVSVFGVLNEDGKEYAETKGSFTWAVAEGVTVALESSTLEQGQVIGLTVKDEAGKNVAGATVKVTSFNTNILDPTTGTGAPSDIELKAGTVAGTTDVEVETTLADGSILTNTFKVTVKEAVTTVENAGYTLTDDITTEAAKYANTEAFKRFATAKTSLVEGSGPVQLIAYSETNGNPDATHLDFTDITRVVSSNPQVATAVQNSAEIDVTPLRAGKTTVTVTMKDGSRKTFPVEVTAKPVMKDISVNATTVNLSDENRTGTAQEGVDKQTVTVTALDQFKKAVANNAEGADPKVTVTSSTQGISLEDTAGAAINNNTDIFTAGDSSAEFVIVAEKDTPVKNARVTVSYFADKDDARPAVTKTINVNVVDVADDAKTANIDVVAPSEIDANAKNITSGTVADQIDFADDAQVQIYALDSDGNRVELLSSPTAEITPATENNYVEVTSTELAFADTENSLTYLRTSNTVNVDVEAAGVTKRLPITYKNTAIVPNKATVATSPVVIKLPSGTASTTFEDIIFGTIDPSQLIDDDATDSTLGTKTGDNAIGVLKTAKNGGYAFNKPLISITGTDGKPLATGVNVYGTDIGATGLTTGNTWFNSVLEGLLQPGTQFVADDFEVEFEVANVNDSSTVSGNTLSSTVTPTSGKATTFTLIITGVYTEGSVDAIEDNTVTGFPTTAQKAAHNLLEKPAQLNVSVSVE